MASTDVNGTLPVAERRVQRLLAARSGSSLLSVPSTVAVRSVGLTPVAEVMGASSVRITVAGYGCGAFVGARPEDYRVQGSDSRYLGYAPLVAALSDGYRQALARLVGEARALGADGVIGVKLSESILDRVGESEIEERGFVAVGTAVRARGGVHPGTPFTTDLDGDDVAKLLLAGWAPVSLLVAVEIALRHDDAAARKQTRVLSGGNVEVPAYTELAHYARRAVRDKLAHAVSTAAADGAIVSALDLSIRRVGCDHRADARITATTLAAFASSRSRPRVHALPMLPLNGQSSATGRNRR